MKGWGSVQIYILLTDKCNLKCSMCIRGRQEGIDLDFDILKNSSWIDDLNKHDIVLTGGEPTLNSRFVEIVDFFCEKAKTVTVTTNGTINNYIGTFILKDNLYFQISIDGDKNMHDSIRGAGVYERSLNTVKRLDELGAQYSVASVVNRSNREAIIRLQTELSKLNNIRYWRVSYEMPFGSANAKEMLSAEEWNVFVDKVIDKARLKLKIKKIFPFYIYEKYKERLDAMIIPESACNNCGSGKDKIYIYPDLEVYPCTCLTDFSLGSLTRNTLQEILNGKSAEKFINYKVKNEICMSCKYLKYCNGGCIGMSYHIFHKLGMGDIRCPKLKEMKD